MFTRVFTSVFFAFTLGAFATEPSPQDEASADPSAPRFISPDGRYGLLVTETDAESQNDRVEVIELATKRSLVVLSDPEAVGDRASDARLDWSEDSQRVAAYTGGRRGGTTQIFVREGDGFAEVKLPDLPDLPDPEKPSPAFAKKHKFKFLKWINTGSVEFVRWLKSGDVEVQAFNEIETVGNGIFRAQINATVVIDSKRHATLKNIVKKEAFE